MNRLARTFADLRRANRAAFIPFITAGDPDMDTSFATLEKLPAAGADIVELGIPFSDPMADGPTNQASYLRALESGATLIKVLALARRFRKENSKTPIVLMGAFNPIHAYGTARFVKDASEAGIDGLLMVDLPAEEDEVLRAPAKGHALDIVRLLAPTTDDARLKVVLEGASGYLYYASIAGITGTKTYDEQDVRGALTRIRRATDLPVAVGFGIRTPEQAAEIARLADGVIVGSSIVAKVEQAVADQVSRADLVRNVVDFCGSLAKSVHAARSPSVVG